MKCFFQSLYHHWIEMPTLYIRYFVKQKPEDFALINSYYRVSPDIEALFFPFLSFIKFIIYSIKRPPDNK